MPNIFLHQKLDNILLKAYFLDAVRYSNYSIKHMPSYSKKYGGLYDIKTKTIVVQNDLSGCNELFLAASLHELAHHVEYTKYGYTQHDEQFREIYERLLFAAFDAKYINPSKLCLAEEYISYYSDSKFVISVCKHHMRLFESKRYQMELTTISEKVIETSYTNSNNKFKKAYCTSNLWYRFTPEGTTSDFIAYKL